ncbi:MAG: CapA family protein [Rhodospirillaceae bacterium]
MRLWSRALCAATLMIAAAASAADVAPLNREWRGRVAELGQAGADELVLTAVGDAIWTHKVSAIPDPRLQALFEVLRRSDISYLNFEQVMADKGFPTLKAIAKADPSIITEFTWAGTDLVSTANNHMMDFGPSGLETTMRVLSENGIKHAGAGMTLGDALRHTTVEKKGLKMALVSVMVSPGLDIGTAATTDSPGVAWVRGSAVRLVNGAQIIAPWQGDLLAMENAIKQARKDAQLVAVSMHFHWGDLEKIDPEGKQLIARAAIDAGADLILGHGPHLINGIEFYKSKPILYSIGNFAFQFPPGAYEFFPDILKTVQRLSSQPELFEGMAVRMVLSTGGAFRRMELLPLALTSAGDPHFVTGPQADAILAKARTLSEPFGTKVNRSSWYAVVDLPGASAP